jgi:hypothetical protein
MNRLQIRAENEEGFALVVALMALVILSLIGIAGLNTSIFEGQIAGNDWSAKRTFYKSDGGTELGSELLEYNFSCGNITSTKITSKVKVITSQLFHNTLTPTSSFPDTLDTPASNPPRDLCWPNADPSKPVVLADCNVGSTAEHTNIKIFGDISLNPGAAIQMAAGYEGKGKGAAGGGAAYLHQIHSQNVGPRGGESVVRVEWRHLVGQEDPTGCY